MNDQEKIIAVLTEVWMADDRPRGEKQAVVEQALLDVAQELHILDELYESLDKEGITE